MTREITVGAKVENIATVTDFMDGLLESANCPMRAKMQIDIAIDELFSNIAHYAYGEGEGVVTLRMELSESPNVMALTFIDRGVPFNPLEREDPDVSLSAEQRQIGGLGIFMVKESMDEIKYEHANGENRLTVVKKW